MKRLYLSNTEKKIAGVCGGLGEYFAIDPTIIRLSVIIVCVVTAFFPVIFGYIVCWLIVPRAPLQQTPA